jgi:hypothetical protein
MSSAYLRRYTDLTALIYLLRKRRLTLLDPSSWDDSNDSYYLTLYKEKRKLNSFWRFVLRRVTKDITTGVYLPQAQTACVSGSTDPAACSRWQAARPAGEDRLLFDAR